MLNSMILLVVATLVGVGSAHKYASVARIKAIGGMAKKGVKHYTLTLDPGFRADRRRLASSSSSDYSSSTVASSDSSSSDDVTAKCEKYPEKHTTPGLCNANACKSWMKLAGHVQAVKACIACGGSGDGVSINKILQIRSGFVGHPDDLCLGCSGRGMTSDDPENVQIWYKPHDRSFVYIRDNDSKEHFTIFQAGRGYGSQQLLENKEWILIELKGHGVMSRMRNRWFNVDKSEAFLQFILEMETPKCLSTRGCKGRMRDNNRCSACNKSWLKLNTTRNFLPLTCNYCKGKGRSCCGGTGKIDRLSETRHAIRLKFNEDESSEEEPEEDMWFYQRWWKNTLDLLN